MAKELAAMAMVPRGATITVLMTYAPLVMMFCSHMGPEMPKAALRCSRSGIHELLSCSMLSSGHTTNRYQMANACVIMVASPVPIAAPFTPMSRTYMNR